MIAKLEDQKLFAGEPYNEMSADLFTQKSIFFRVASAKSVCQRALIRELYSVGMLEVIA